MKRATIRLRELERRLVRRLAREWRMAERDVLELAVWAYVLPLAPSLEAPHERPAPSSRPAPARGKR